MDVSVAGGQPLVPFSVCPGYVHCEPGALEGGLGGWLELRVGAMLLELALLC